MTSKQSVARLDETPFFFERDGRALFGILHRPADSSRDEAFVFCHPFGEEKLWTHRVFVSYARQLALAGYSVLRFDFLGNGDSDGAFSESSVDTACADTLRAIEEVGRLTGARHISLLGLRLGATIAGVVADQSPEVGRLILWSPIVNGARYMQELLRSNVMTQMATLKEIRQDREQLVAALQSELTVNVDGYEMSRALYNSVSAIDGAAQPHSFAGDCLIVQADPQPKPAPDLQRLAATYPNCTVKFAQEEPFWKEIPRFYQEAPSLFSVTNDWLGGDRDTPSGPGSERHE